MNETKSKLLSYDEALARILAHVPQTGSERVALDAAVGRVLRRDVRADRDQPPFDRVAMDGFAVRSAEVRLGAVWPIVGDVAAGAALAPPLEPGTTVRIATGAPLPPGADAVVQVELATEEAGDPPRVRFALDACSPWRNIHRRAADAAAGDTVLPAGTRLGPAHIGIAAAAGAVELDVAAPLRVALVTTGDEVVPPQTPTDALQPQQIRNSNGPMLRAMLAALGTHFIEHLHVPDDPQRILAAARDALSRSHLVLTVGGVSAGRRDFLPWAWRELGLRELVHGVAIQPGKPLFAATPSHDDAADNKLVLGLPGNPVSVLATAHLFVWPVVRASAGEPALPWRMVPLAEPVQPSATRERFRAARLEPDGRAAALPWQGSGDLTHTAPATGWLRLPPANTPLDADALVDYLPMV